MKKFYSFLVAAAMVLGATSCQQEAINEPSENAGIKSFVASVNTTRTELGANDKVMWNANDKIRIYSQENTAGVVFEGDAEEASTVATFTATEQFATSSTGYFAVYPEVKHYYNAGAADNQSVAATASYANDVWSVPVHISELQEPTAGAWDERFNVMAAYTTNNKLAFKACTALLEFTWTGVSNPMGGVSFTATGANLAGEGTLSYSTADGKISVTTEGTETFISLMGIENGETYYIPLFPGKVTGFKLSAYNSSWMMEDYISYEGEFEFKAGVIYSKKAGDEPVATPSPWTMTDPNMGTQASMTIDDNGYHVAKAVPAGNFVFYKYDMDNGEQYLSASKELGLNEWQATATDMAIAISIPMDNMFDVYLAPDASMFCLVETGATVPEMPSKYHIYVYNSSNWDKVNLYVWDANDNKLNGAWSGTALTTTMVGEVEYYVYDIPNEYIGQTINFIINNGSAQTADLSMVVESDVYYYTNGDVVEDPANPVIPEAKKLYLVPNNNWKVDNARFAAYFFGAGETWVSMTDEDGDSIYECELPEGYPNVIFCRMNPGTTDNNWDNKWNQTSDLTVPTDGTNCYTVPEGSWDNGNGTWSTK